MMPVPNGLKEILTTYGDYHPFLRSDYTISPSWERATLGTCWLPMPLRLGWDPSKEVQKIRMHRLITLDAAEIFGRIAKAGLWTKLRTFDGCYAWRAKRGVQKLSTHCWGIALDFNAATNQLGEKGDMDPQIVEIFEGAGWEWGGRWDRSDPMHFQAAKGY
jgi:hypothetical protein